MNKDKWSMKRDQPFFRTFLSLYLEAFECNATSDWLNHTV